MRDRSALGAAGLVVCGLALAALAAQPEVPRPASGPAQTVAPRSASGTAQRAHGPRASAPPAHPRSPAAQVAVLRDGGRLDLNTATTGDLELLPGIGPTLAQRIVEDRARRGAYRVVDDLTRVSGIGPGKLARLRTLVVTGATNPRDHLN